MKCVLAIDQGTTGTTCLIITADGRVAGRGYREITQHFPEPGQVEHDADEIFSRTLDAAREAIAQSGLVPSAIGITNQRETDRALGSRDRRAGRPTRSSGRTGARRRGARNCAAEQRRSARRPASSRSLFLRNEARVAARAHGCGARAPRTGELAFGTIDSWLIWRLTGRRRARDRSDQRVPHDAVQHRHAATGRRSCWRCSISRGPCCPRCAARAASSASRPRSISDGRCPIAGIAGDQQAALFGQACCAGNGQEHLRHRLLPAHEHRARAPDRPATGCSHGGVEARGATGYALEGSVFVAGAAMQWLRDGLGIIGSAAEIEALRGRVPRHGGVNFVPALHRARRALLGSRRARRHPRTHARHDARASGARRAGGDRIPDRRRTDGDARRRGGRSIELRVDGGASANDLLLQFQADLLGVPVVRPDVTETTALGAGWLAGLAAGFWPECRIVHRVREQYTRFAPGEGSRAARAALAGMAPGRPRGGRLGTRCGAMTSFPVPRRAGPTDRCAPHDARSASSRSGSRS